ncbi:hypothetical protein [Bacillus sp. 1P06AnD]|uniref:hypothetical protein n=2 Tax=Bacillus sp. 1P06AnD TaxID=3132208 RepID=UPI0039A1EE80
MVEQLNIYHELGPADDPIFNQLSILDNTSRLTIAGLYVQKNQFGLYELWNSDYHECSSTLMGCYEKVKNMIETREDKERLNENNHS